jgi:hypothetical protein
MTGFHHHKQITSKTEKIHMNNTDIIVQDASRKGIDRCTVPNARAVPARQWSASTPASLPCAHWEMR